MLINREGWVYLLGPGVDAATKIINRFESGVLEKHRHALASDPVMTHHDNGLLPVQIFQSGWNLAHRDIYKIVQRAGLNFPRFPHIQQHVIRSFLVDPMFVFTNR